MPLRLLQLPLWHAHTGLLGRLRTARELVAGTASALAHLTPTQARIYCAWWARCLARQSHCVSPTLDQLYAEHEADRRLFGGWEFPSEWVQSINPLLIIFLTGTLRHPFGGEA